MAIGLVFSVSRYVGVMPFDKTGHFDGRAFSTATAFLIGLSAFVWSAKFRRTHATPDAVLSLTQYTLQILSVFGHVYAAWAHRRRMSQVLTRVSLIRGPEFDLKLVTLGSIICFFATYRSVLLKGVKTVSALSGFGIILFTYLNFLVVAQFCTVISRLKWALDQLLIKIRLYKIDVGEHFDVVMMAKTTNEIYSFQLIVTLITMFSYMVAYPYFAVAQARRVGDISYFASSHFIYLMLHVALRILMLLAITTSCHNTSITITAAGAPMNVFQISKFFGVFPFNRDNEFDNDLLLYCSAVQLIVNAAWLCQMTLLWIVDYYNSSSSYLNLFLHILSQSLNVFCTVAHIAKMKRNRAFMGKVLSLVQAHESGRPYRSLAVGAVLIFGRSSPIALYRLMEANYRKMTEEFMYMFSSFIKLMVTLQFCSIVVLIRRKVEELNDDTNQFKINTAAHFNLVLLLKGVNRIFGWQLLSTFCQIFVHIVSNGYWFMLDFIYPDYDSSGYINYRFSNVSAVVYAFYEVYAIIRACQSSSYQVENFNTELFRLMRESNQLCENEKLYLYATMKNSVTFTACGFFNLGYPLVTSIIAAAATYLVILLQFSSESLEQN